MSDENYQALEETIKCYQTKVQKNVEIVTPDSLGQKKLLHIAMSKFKALIPNVSRRAAYSEDNTVPRVHTAPTLLNCIFGHAGVFWTAINEPPGTKTKDQYLGGFYIYSIPFDYALKPSKKLVYDVELTNEHWLVSYNEKTRDYPVSSVGKFIVCGTEVIPYASGKLEQVLNIVIEVPSGEEYRLDETVTLSTGFYRAFIETDDRNKFNLLRHSTITGAVFEEERNLRTTLLSYGEKIKGW